MSDSQCTLGSGREAAIHLPTLQPVGLARLLAVTGGDWDKRPLPFPVIAQVVYHGSWELEKTVS